MSFLFGKKSKSSGGGGGGGGGSVGSSRDLDSRAGHHGLPGAGPNGVPGVDNKPSPPTNSPAAVAAAAAGAPAVRIPKLAVAPQGLTPGPVPDATMDSRKQSQDDTHTQRSNQPPNATLYPWSCQDLAFTTAAANPFPRYGAAVNVAASKDGDIYMMGGLVDGQTVKGDLWMIEAGTDKLSCYPVKTEQEGPGPRVGHAALLVGNAFIVFGGDTKQEENDELDDTLYLLNTSTKLWSRAMPPGIRPAGRYGHTLNILGSRLYIFGGQNDGHFFNDLVAFDLNQLQNPHQTWEVLVQDTEDVEKPGVVAPPARTNHSIVTYNDKLYLFGGTDGISWFNDVWTFDPRTTKWSQLDCIGYIPQPREGHSAALVNDVMYIFGGRTQEGGDLGDLAAFRISSRRWYTFQNMGPSPSPRSGHSMTAHEKKIVVLAGEPSSSERDPEELSLVYVLDTTKIRYPNDSSLQNTPTTDRGAPGVRRPSGAGQTSIPRGPLLASGPNSPATAPPAGSKLPKPTGGAPAGPPPRGPPPRVNGAGPGPLPGIQPLPGSRSGTPTRGYETQNGPYGRPDLGGEGLRGPPSRSMSPALQARLTTSQTQPQPSKLANTIDEEFEPPVAPSSRSRSQSQVQRPNLGVDSTAYPLQPAQQQSAQQQPAQQQPAQQQPAQHQPAQQQNFSHTPAIDTTSATRSAGPVLRTQDSISNAQLEALKQELEGVRKKAAMYESELALARKAGYTQSTNLLLPDERSIVNESDKPLVEALVMMKRELEEVQSSVAQRAQDASRRVAVVEQQRDAAIKEAVYHKAKLAARGGSQAGTPQPDETTHDLDNERSTEISRKLGAALTLQNEMRSKLEHITAQHESERRAREVAEQNAEAAQRRATELEQLRSPGEIEELRADLHDAQKTARNEAAARAAHQGRAKMLEIERDDLKSQLELFAETSTDHEASLAYLRQAMSASEDKVNLLEQKLQEARDEREAAMTKLRQLMAEHEEQAAELMMTNRKLRDAEELAEKHAREAQTHKNAVMMGLKERSDKRSDSSASNKAAEQRITVLQQQVDDATQLAKKSQHEADIAAEKLRGAEERIAGLETFQQQASRENLTIRKQLQDAIKSAQVLQAQHNEVKRELENHQRNASALSLQHSALKDLLDERSDSAASRGVGSPDIQRVRELEHRLEESERRQEETRSQFSATLEETEAEYREKLEQLENDYQSAVSYVKGTEKMLKRMKDELTKSKQVNTRLEKDLERAQRSGSRTEALAPAGWEEERSRLQQEIEETQEHVKTSIAQLEQQLVAVHAEREQMRHENDELVRNMAGAHDELEKLRLDNVELSARAADAENKVSLLLDQVESSVDQYRRRSRASMGVNGTSHQLPHGHARTISSGSDYTATGGGHGGHGHSSSTGSEGLFNATGGHLTATGSTGDDRGSLALDNLASELESLRTQWEGTHRSYRMSNSYNLGLDRIGAESDLAGGGLSDSLASWRKRLEAEERSKTSSRSGSRTGERTAAASSAGGIGRQQETEAAGMNMI